MAVRVIPRARQTRIDGLRSDALLVRLAAPPVDGAANDALLDFLARPSRVPSPSAAARLRRNLARQARPGRGALTGRGRVAVFSASVPDRWPTADHSPPPAIDHLRRPRRRDRDRSSATSPSSPTAPSRLTATASCSPAATRTCRATSSTAPVNDGRSTAAACRSSRASSTRTRTRCSPATGATSCAAGSPAPPTPRSRPTGGGIVSTVRATRGPREDELVEPTRQRLDEMLACGTTTAEVKSGYGLDVETELKMLRAIRRLGGHAPDRHRADLHGRARDPRRVSRSAATTTSAWSSTDDSGGRGGRPRRVVRRVLRDRRVHAGRVARDSASRGCARPEAADSRRRARRERRLDRGRGRRRALGRSPDLRAGRRHCERWRERASSRRCCRARRST